MISKRRWFRGVVVGIAVAVLLIERSQGFVQSPLPYRVLKLPFCPSSSSRVTPGALTSTRYRPWQRRRGQPQWPLFLNLDSDDPFQVLGLDEPTTDKKVIKRAYKRMALQYHPDVATNKESTREEKKLASDRFAKINWAYEVLSGKRQNDSTYASSKSASSSAGSSSSSGWTPPHRRSGPYTSSTREEQYPGGVDWTDFMPKYNDEDYDAGGDSFGKIFGDFVVGAAAGAAGLGGGGSNVFRDFIDFLEGNVDGFGSGDDAELRILLQTGSLDDIRNELDDTELVVQQLKSKLSGIQDEILTTTARTKSTSRYMEKIELEEALAELNARKDVVQGYVKKAQKRLLSLQTRYKELLMGGGRDPSGRSTTSRSSWDDIKNEAGTSSSYSTSPGRDYSSSSSSSAGSTSTDYASKSQRTPKNDDDSWMNESFGSSTYGRGRGSGRQRSRRNRSASSASSESAADYPRETTPRQPEPPRASSTNTRGYSAGSQSTSPSSSSLRNTPSSNVPPHRRTSGSYENQQEKDKRRLRELKVDEEFDKLKKDLGL